MALEVIMPNKHGIFKDNNECIKNLKEMGKRRGRTQFPSTPHKTKTEPNVCYVKSLLNVMCGVFVWLCCRGERCGKACGVLLYAVMLCGLPAVTEGFCPSGCVCNYSIMKVSCDAVGLEVVPILLNPHVQSLNLHSNNIQTLAHSLVFYLDLRFLDLSVNEIESLGEGNFKEQHNLKELRLGHNKLQSVEAKSLRGLEGLHKLVLHHNAISHLENSAFQGLGDLTDLDLSYNQLRGLGTAGLSGLTSLNSLDLSGNRLKHIPSGHNLTSLRYLNLSLNLISQVPPSAFSGFPGLTSLILDRNNISLISATAFNALTELGRLSITDNRLIEVPSSSLDFLPHLQHLDLSGNLFESLPQDCFRGLRGLQNLSVSRCPRLHTVSGEAFISSASLRSLQLRHNPRLGNLPSAVLASLLTLRHLDLSSCGLRTLTPTQIPLQNLRSLRLAGNPLMCNCSLVWFGRLAADPNSTITLDQPSCASPPSLYGASLQSLGGDDFGCQSSVGVWVAVVGVGIAVLLLLLLTILLVICWRRRRRKRKNEGKGYLEDPFLPDGGLSITRLPSRPQNEEHAYCTPTRLGPPPRLPSTHPLHQHLHHQGCMQQCPYAALHLYRPLLHPDFADRRPSPPSTPSSMTSPPPLPLTDPPNWYATIGGDGGEDSGRESRPPTPFDHTLSPRKVPVTYV